jgi:hypothetical protein
VVLVTAKRRSVHRDGPTAGASKLVYNIGALVLTSPADGPLHVRVLVSWSGVLMLREAA